MHSQKYNKITHQRKEICTKTTSNKLPSIKTRALTLGHPNRALPLNSLLPHQTSNVQRQASAANIQAIKQTLSVRQSHSNKLRGLDKQIVIEQRSKSVKRYVQVPGLSSQAMLQRRQSNLNTYFNTRKNKLQQITKENKRIYVRINSQKSIYSSRHNSSTDSAYNSRLSHDSLRHSIDSIRKSIKLKKNLKKAVLSKKQQPNMKIQSKDINRLGNKEVNTYLNVFCSQFSSNKAKEQNMPHQMQRGKQNINGHADGLGKILEEMQQKRQPKKRHVFSRLI